MNSNSVNQFQSRCFFDEAFFYQKPREKHEIHPYMRVFKFLSCSEYFTVVKHVCKLFANTFLDSSFFERNPTAVRDVLCKNPQQDWIRSCVLSAAGTIEELYFSGEYRRYVPNEWLLQQFLQKATQLTCLSLRMLAVNFSSIFQALANPKALQEVYFEYTPIDDTALQQLLQRCKQLKVVGVSRCQKLQFTPKTCQLFAELQFLEKLHGSQTRFHDQMMRICAALPKLTYLDIDGCRELTKKGYPLLEQSKSLQEVDDRSIDEHKLRTLVRMPALRRLDLSDHERLNDRIFECFKDSKSLEEIVLNNTRVSDGGMQAVCKIPTLTKLSIVGCSRITDAGYRALRQSRTLKHLVLDNLLDLSLASEQAVMHIPHWETIEQVRPARALQQNQSISDRLDIENVRSQLQAMRV